MKTISPDEGLPAVSPQGAPSSPHGSGPRIPDRQPQTVSSAIIIPHHGTSAKRSSSEELAAPGQAPLVSGSARGQIGGQTSGQTSGRLYPGGIARPRSVAQSRSAPSEMPGAVPAAIAVNPRMATHAPRSDVAPQKAVVENAGIFGIQPADKDPRATKSDATNEVAPASSQAPGSANPPAADFPVVPFSVSPEESRAFQSVRGRDVMSAPQTRPQTITARNPNSKQARAPLPFVPGTFVRGTFAAGTFAFPRTDLSKVSPLKAAPSTAPSTESDKTASEILDGLARPIDHVHGNQAGFQAARSSALPVISSHGGVRPAEQGVEASFLAKATKPPGSVDVFSELDRVAIQTTSGYAGTATSLQIGIPDASFGAVGVQAHLAGGKVSASIQVGREPAMHLLTRELPTIQQFLADSHVAIRHMSVELAKNDWAEDGFTGSDAKNGLLGNGLLGNDLSRGGGGPSAHAEREDHGSEAAPQHGSSGEISVQPRPSAQSRGTPPAAPISADTTGGLAARPRLSVQA